MRTVVGYIPGGFLNSAASATVTGSTDAETGIPINTGLGVGQIAEYEQKHGSNGETVTPSASKFDKFRELPAEKKDSWKTSVGREASNAARQEKYRDLLAGSRVQ